MFHASGSRPSAGAPPLTTAVFSKLFAAPPFACCSSRWPSPAPPAMRGATCAATSAWVSSRLPLLRSIQGCARAWNSEFAVQRRGLLEYVPGRSRCELHLAQTTTPAYPPGLPAHRPCRPRHPALPGAHPAPGTGPQAQRSAAAAAGGAVRLPRLCHHAGAALPQLPGRGAGVPAGMSYKHQQQVGRAAACSLCGLGLMYGTWQLLQGIVVQLSLSARLSSKLAAQ